MTYFEFLNEHGITLLLGTVTTVKVLVCSMILYVVISMIFGLMRLSKNLFIQGIATMHKSNLVPVTREGNPKDYATMRRN